MKLMRSLNFVKVVDLDSTAEQQLSSAQKETWSNIKQGFEEMKLAEEGKVQTRPMKISSKGEGKSGGSRVIPA